VRFTETELRGAYVVEPEPRQDMRGFFARLWCEREFAALGLHARVVQVSMSRNLRRGTVRGMHMQLPPSREAKLVSCMRGRIYDVIVDLRPGSPTYLRHFAIELDAERHTALYIPPGMLHGFQTLEDDSEVLYHMSDFHAEHLAFGARWNDPAFGILWPESPQIVILPRDAEYPDFDSDAYLARVAGATARCAAGE